MGATSIATQRSDAENNYIAPHIRAYDILITRATDFLAAKDIASSQRVARLLLRSPGLCRAHQMTCYEMLSHCHRHENGVYNTAQALSVQSFEKGAVKVVSIPPRSSRSSRCPGGPQAPHTPRPSSKSGMPIKPSMKRVPSTPIKKDDVWITSPSKPPTRAPKTVKRVTFAEPFKPIKDTVKENMKKAKVDLTNSRVGVGGASVKGLAERARGSDKYKCLPDKQNVLDLQFRTFSTPTGFTVEDIEALGNFPDYATLGGVPLPAAYTNFDIETALPRPYRPFRWEYHQTMSYKKLEPDWWLELDKTYTQRIKQRQDLYVKHGSDILQALPGSEIACKELMEICLQFLCARYPSYFFIDKQTLHFHNGILNTKTNLREVDPLVVLLNNVPEDFAIVLRDPKTGYYSFRAGVVCSSIGWTVGSKIGMNLKDIHTPVPDYKEKMEFSMDRFFAKFPTDKPIQRGSWGLEIDTPLFMPPGSPTLALHTSQSPALSVSSINLRVDWQTLRRLPLSGAICFNFKCVFTPLSEFEDEKGIPGLVRKVLSDGKKSLLEYKGTWHVEHVALPELERMEKEQEKRGLIEEGWVPRTLDEYPYFEGWEEKWHRQQGF